MNTPESAEVDAFKCQLLEAELLDPHGLHHEFVGGNHGRKLEFEKIPDGSDLFYRWARLGACAIENAYPASEYASVVILSVATGTDRLVPHIASRMGQRATAQLTEKISPRAVRLSAQAFSVISRDRPALVVACEDAATTGSTSATAVQAARQAGAHLVVVMNTWQRQDKLPELEAIKAPFFSIIHENLPTFTPDDCRSRGYCAKGWQLIEHD